MERIGIIGIGRLGLCLALQLERRGCAVTGVDLDAGLVKSLNDKTFVTEEPLVTEYLRQAKYFRASTDAGELTEGGISMIFILVATPSAPDGGYDHSQIERATDSLVEFGRRTSGAHLVVGCTTMPGYCDRLAEKMAPYGYTLSYKPEFIAQGSIMHDMERPDMILIGEGSEEAGELIETRSRKICGQLPVCHRMDRLSAEICKLATNCFLTTKISFANAIGDLALRAGADPQRILAAIGSDSRIGQRYLNYGYGFGGPCFPRDNRALSCFAREQGSSLPLSEATETVNRQHLEFQVQHWMRQYQPYEVIEFDRVTYKKESTSLEESQQLALCVQLAKAGRKVLIKERPVVVDELRKRYGDLFLYQIQHA